MGKLDIEEPSKWTPYAGQGKANDLGTKSTVQEIEHDGRKWGRSGEGIVLARQDSRWERIERGQGDHWRTESTTGLHW